MLGSVSEYTLDGLLMVGNAVDADVVYCVALPKCTAVHSMILSRVYGTFTVFSHRLRPHMHARMVHRCDAL